MAKIKKSQQKKLNQIGEYLVGGGVWFWSGYIIIVFLSGRISLFWANFIGNAVGLTLNFIIERYWVFKANRPTTLFMATKRYIIYTLLNAFMLNYFILAVLKNQYDIPVKYGQFFAAGFFTVWNYFWYKYWVFKGQDRQRRVRHYA